MRDNHYMLVLFGNVKDEHGIDLETECLHAILQKVMTVEHFCIVHELANRYRITSNYSKLLREFKYPEMRAFRFFINKN
jgi:hypothetical protein